MHQLHNYNLNLCFISAIYCSYGFFASTIWNNFPEFLLCCNMRQWVVHEAIYMILCSKYVYVCLFMLPFRDHFWHEYDLVRTVLRGAHGDQGLVLMLHTVSSVCQHGQLLKPVYVWVCKQIVDMRQFVLRLFLLYKIICDKFLFIKTGMAHHCLAFRTMFWVKKYCDALIECSRFLDSFILFWISFTLPAQKWKISKWHCVRNLFVQISCHYLYKIEEFTWIVHKASDIYNGSLEQLFLYNPIL